MGCEILHYQWTCYKKEDQRYITSRYFIIYEATIGVILYWNSDQPFVIHRSHHVWFGKYNYCLSIEDKQTPFSLRIQQDPESHVNNLDLLILVTCEIDLTYIPFCDTTILTYEIDLPTSGNKFRFNLLDGE